MKLFYEPCNIDIGIEEGRVYGLSIENPLLFRSFLENVYKQTTGKEGDIFLSRNGKEVKFEKEATVIFNPFSIDLNEKRIITKLYSELKDIANQDLFEQQANINSQVVAFIDDLGSKIPYPINFSLELDFLQLLKIYSVRIDSMETGIAEKIVNYIRLTHQILGMKTFFFVHLCDYLTESELVSLNEMICYENVVVLDIETDDKKRVPNSKWWIIDFDNCIIEV